MTSPTHTSRGCTQHDRLETSVIADQKSAVAAAQVRTETDVVPAGVREAAGRTMEEYQRLDLSVRDSQAFVEALINPQPVNNRLRDTVRRYRQGH